MLIRKTALALAMAASVAAPAANASEMCQTIKDVIKIGLKDPSFTSLQSTPYVLGADKGVIATRQVDGYVCKVSIEGGRGFFACQRDDANTGVTEAASLSTKIQHCVGIAPSVSNEGWSTSYSYVYRADPKLLVYLSGSKGKLVFLNVVAYGAPTAPAAPPSSSSSSSGKNSH